MPKDMTLRFTDEAWKAFQEIMQNAVHDEAIMTIQRAIATYQLMHRIMAKGGTIMAHYPDGRSRVIEL